MHLVSLSLSHGNVASMIGSQTAVIWLYGRAKKSTPRSYFDLVRTMSNYASAFCARRIAD